MTVQQLRAVLFARTCVIVNPATVGVGVAVGVAVGVGVGVGVAITVGVGFGVGVGVALTVGATYVPRTTSPGISWKPTPKVIEDFPRAVNTKL